MKPPLPPNESERLEILRRYEILDTPPENTFDALTRLASNLCETPIALITFVNSERQWFKSKIGINPKETSREDSFCAHAILQRQPLVIHDTFSDPRFAESPWVASDPHIRFYAGAPLLTSQGHPLGTVCVMDYAPRELRPKQIEGLQTIAHETMMLLELRRQLSDLSRTVHRLREAEERDRFFNLSLDLLFIAGFDGFIRQINPAFESVCGATTETLRSKPLIEFIHPDDQEQTAAELEKLKKGGQTDSFEIRIIQPDGSWRWILWSATSLTEKELIYAVGHDITDLKRAQEEIKNLNQDLEERVRERTAQLSATNRALEKEIAQRREAEGALRISEEKYRFLFENNPHPMWVFDLETLAFLDVNEAAVRHYGYSREEFLSMTIKDIRPPDEVPRLLNDFKRMSPGVAQAGVWKHRKKDGTLIDVEITRDRIPFAGKQAGIVLANDVTERKRAEEALRKSEERFQFATRATNDVIWDLDLTTNILWWNEGFKTTFGYKGEEIEQTVAWWRERIHPEDKERVLLSIHAAAERGDQFWSAEYRFRRGDGSYASILDRGYVVHESSGRPVRIIGAMMDITERKKAEQALEAEKERLTVTLRSIGDGVITTDVEERVVLMNNVAETLIGWTQEEALGRPLHQIFNILDEKSGQPVENPATQALQIGAAVGLADHTVLISRTGIKRTITDSASPIRDRTGRTLGVVLVFRDITAKQKMEEDLLRTSKLEAVGLLGGGIAHDFNNILTAILGNISLVKLSANPKDPLYKQLTEAETASLRARDLAQQLLTFAKGGTPIKKTVSIKELLRESIRFVLHGSNVGVEFFISDDLWPVEIDEGQISQVLHNLVINAQQAMPQGGIIEVHADNYPAGELERRLPLPPGRYVRIAIRDFGIGIPKEHLPRIFDPYFTTKQKGSGLGLSTSYSIIKKHDGTMMVDSELGKGSTFSFYLPAASHEAGLEERPEAPLQGHGKILVMDDEPAVREVAGEILRFLGYQVEFAEDGSEAIARYQDALASGKPFDLTIMDLTVPGKMGGKEAVQRLREIDPHVKAIVSSGYSNDPIMSDYHRYGFKGVIAKPYQLEQLRKSAHDVITGPSK